MRLILGSSSPYRRAILKQAGYDCEILSPQIDEKSIRSADPYALPLLVARAKAAALMPRLTGHDARLISVDQVVVCEGKLFEKPASAEEVRSFFAAYSRAPAETVTAVVVTDTLTGKQHEGTDTAKVFFNPLPAQVIEEYLQLGEPFHYSGAFNHEHPLLQPYIRSIEGDPDSVTGMPMKLLERLLGESNLRKDRVLG